MVAPARSVGGAPTRMFVGGQPVARARRRVRWSGGIGAALGLAEVAAVVAAGLVARTAPAPLALACAVALVVARAADLHRARLVLWIVEDLPALLVTAAAVTAVLVVAGDAPPVIGVLEPA